MAGDFLEPVVALEEVEQEVGIEPRAAREDGVIRASEAGLRLVIGEADGADVDPHRVVGEPVPLDALIAREVVGGVAGAGMQPVLIADADEVEVLRAPAPSGWHSSRM